METTYCEAASHPGHGLEPQATTYERFIRWHSDLGFIRQMEDAPVPMCAECASNARRYDILSGMGLKVLR